MPEKLPHWSFFQSQDSCPLCTCFCPGRQSVQPSSLSSSSYAMRAEKRESPVPSLPLAKESQTQTTPERERNHWGSGARGWIFNRNYWNSLSALTLLPIRSFSPLSVRSLPYSGRWEAPVPWHGGGQGLHLSDSLRLPGTPPGTVSVTDPLRTSEESIA